MKNREIKFRAWDKDIKAWCLILQLNFRNRSAYCEFGEKNKERMFRDFDNLVWAENQELLTK